MRFWKTGAAGAIVIAAAAVVQPGGAEARGQVIVDREILEPLDRAQQILTVFGGTRLGVTIDDVDADDVKAKKLSSESGAVIESVETDSPASKAGLRAGDVIVEFDGERVRSESQLRRLVQETPSGRRVAIVVVRDGQRVPLSVTLESQRRGMSLWTEPRVHPTPAPRPPRAPNPPAIPDRFVHSFGGARLGVSTQTLTDQLATHFGVDGGVLVSEVDEDSAAAKAGLRAGDVITKFNGQTIDDAGDLVREVARADGEVTIDIVRDRKPQTLKATVERARSRSLRRVI